MFDFRDPNGLGLQKWPQFEAQDQAYLVINAKPSVRNVYEAGRFRAWRNLLTAIKNDENQLKEEL